MTHSWHLLWEVLTEHIDIFIGLGFAGKLPASCQKIGQPGQTPGTYCGDIGSVGADGTCYCDGLSQILKDSCADYNPVRN